MAAPALASSCSPVPFSVAQPIVERFLFRPDTLLAESRGPSRTNPSAESNRLRDTVAVLASSSRASLTPIMRVARVADGVERRQIANGLALASLLCAQRDPARARAIQTAVRSANDGAMMREFASVAMRNTGAAPGTAPAAAAPVRPWGSPPGLAGAPTPGSPASPPPQGGFIPPPGFERSIGPVPPIPSIGPMPSIREAR